MSTIDCHGDLKGYHDKKVTLGTAEQADMRTRRDAGRTRMKNGLAAAEQPAPSAFHAQGSYAMRTMVQDSQNDYDIDDGAYFEKDDLRDANGNDLAPRDARQRVASALKDDRLAYDAKVRNNCVRQAYPPGYHIDIPVYRVLRSTDIFGKEKAEYELASGDEWVKSDAREVTSWYKSKVTSELDRGQDDTSQLRRITKLTKKQARSRLSWKSQTTSGIAITKLVVDHQRLEADRDDLALRRTWQAIKTQLDFSQSISHPIAGNRDLANEGDEAVKYFRDRLAEALETLKILDDPKCTKAQAREAWNAVFNTTYFSDLPDDGTGGGTKASGPFVISSGKTTKRDDDNGRFG